MNNVAISATNGVGLIYGVHSMSLKIASVKWNADDWTGSCGQTTSIEASVLKLEKSTLHCLVTDRRKCSSIAIEAVWFLRSHDFWTMAVLIIVLHQSSHLYIHEGTSYLCYVQNIRITVACVFSVILRLFDCKLLEAGWNIRQFTMAASIFVSPVPLILPVLGWVGYLEWGNTMQLFFQVYMQGSLP